MKLLTKKIKERFEKVGEQNVVHGEEEVIARYFNPVGRGTWLATQYDPERELFYGWVSLIPGCEEWGVFSLKELENIELPLGMKIERDLHFNGKVKDDIFWQQAESSINS